MDWFVYIIMASNNALYTGITNNIERRWQQHTGQKVGGAKFFNGRKPVALAYVEVGFDRSTASKREYAIKQLTRQEKEALLKMKSNKSGDYRGVIPILEP